MIPVLLGLTSVFIVLELSALQQSDRLSWVMAFEAEVLFKQTNTSHFFGLWLSFCFLDTMKHIRGRILRAVCTTSSWESSGLSSTATWRSQTTRLGTNVCWILSRAAFLVKNYTKLKATFKIKAKRSSEPSTGNGQSVCTVLTQPRLMLTKKMIRKILRRRRTANR